MATTTTNFGFDVPTSSDLVKNGATQIALLGQDIDTFLFGGATRAAGKNFLINGAMDFWQRSTSSASLGYVTADRWYINNASGTTTSSQETSIVPTGVARYALKLTQSVASAQVVAQQPLESQLAIPLAGQTIIVSAYVAASASTNFTIDLGQSTSTDVAAAGSWTFTSGSSQNVATTAYVRVSQTFTVSGTSKSLMPRISMTSLGSGNSFYFSGLQMEIGSQATPFTRAGGTIQGELAACQRYYFKMGNEGNAYNSFGLAGAASVNAADFVTIFPVKMRIAPTAIESSAAATIAAGSILGVTSIAFNSATNSQVAYTALNKTAAFVATGCYPVYANNSGTAYFAWSAEL